MAKIYLFFLNTSELYLENAYPPLQNQTFYTLVHCIEDQRFQYYFYHRECVYYLISQFKGGGLILGFVMAERAVMLAAVGAKGLKNRFLFYNNKSNLGISSYDNI